MSCARSTFSYLKDMAFIKMSQQLGTKYTFEQVLFFRRIMAQDIFVQSEPSRRVRKQLLCYGAPMPNHSFRLLFLLSGCFWLQISN